MTGDGVAPAAEAEHAANQAGVSGNTEPAPTDEGRSRRELLTAIAAIDADWPPPGVWDEYCNADEREGYLVGTISDHGNGVDAGHSSETRIYRDGQPRLRVGEGHLDGQYVSVVRFDRPINDESLQVFSHATGSRVISEGDDAMSRAKLFLSAALETTSHRGPGFVVHGPLYTESNMEVTETCRPLWGTSEGLPPLFLRQPVPPSRFFRFETPAIREDPAPHLLRIAGVTCNDGPTQVGPYAVRTFNLGGRNGGVAIAIAGADGRFRWALETRNALLGTNARWVGAHRGWVFGATYSRHPGYIYDETGALFAIRARDGVVVRIDAPPRFRDGMVTQDTARHTAVEDCADAKMTEAGLGQDYTVDQWAEFESACEETVPRTDGLQIDGESLRIQQADTRWVAISTPALFEVLERIP